MAAHPIRTVLLTGAGGFIGSRWLGERPSAYEVTGVIRPGSNIPAGVSVREVDLLNASADELVAGFDAVVHLAGLLPAAGIAESDYMRVNRDATVALAEACARIGARFLFASTSALYGGTDGKPRRESEIEVSGANAYARSKFEAEEHLLKLQGEGLLLTTLRFASVYGSAPRMQYHTAVNAFVRMAARGKPIEVWRSGLATTRPYTWAGDAAAALSFFLDRDLFGGDIYNIVSENASMQEVLTEVQTRFPESVVALVENEQMNDRSFGMDNSRVRALGFMPQGTLRKGITEVAAVAAKP
jgi:UDP-glucose 4-epimerase